MVFRVERFVASPLPHRPGRADFPHPVPLFYGFAKSISAICISTVDIFLVSCTFDVSKIQLRNTGIPLPYLVAFMELISHPSIGTMKMLRLPSLISLPSVPLGADTAWYHLFLFAI